MRQFITSVSQVRHRCGPTTWWATALATRSTLRASRAAPALQAHGAPPAVWLDLRYAAEAPLAPPLVIVYIHGGGFCSHMATENFFAAMILPKLAKRGVMARVLALDYDYHKPDRNRQIESILYAWRRVAQVASPATKLCLAGDSAGGHLAAAVVTALLDARMGGTDDRLPSALVLISPWLEVALPPADANAPHAERSWRTGRSCNDIISRPLATALAKECRHERNYLLETHGAAEALGLAALAPPHGVSRPNGVNALNGPPSPPSSGPDSPRGMVGSPPRSSFNGETQLSPSRSTPPSPCASPRACAVWPRTLIFVGGAELLADDSRRLAAILAARHDAADGTREKQIEIWEEPGACHDWLLLPWLEQVPGEADRGMDGLVEFLCASCHLMELQKEQVNYGV